VKGGGFMDDFWTKEQKENLAYFKDNLQKFLSDPLLKFKYVIIYNKDVVGRFDTFEAALVEAVSKYPQNAYIIQQIISEKDTVSFLYSAMKIA
jgi:hypothetical protein